MKNESKYKHDLQVHNLEAPRILVPAIMKMLWPKSVVDVGCGIGTFLSVFSEMGVDDLLGIDGDWVDRSKFFVTDSMIQIVDLEGRFNQGRTFDLALCLEVAEHISEEKAKDFISGLCSLSKTIIFSAAIPGQGGQHHVNEQPFSFWQEMFSDFGYSFYDVFRDQFWTDSRVNWWYRQNMFLVVHDSQTLRPEIERCKILGTVNTYVHPELFELMAARVEQLEEALGKMRTVRGVFSASIRRLQNKLVRPRT